MLIGLFDDPVFSGGSIVGVKGEDDLRLRGEFMTINLNMVGAG